MKINKKNKYAERIKNKILDLINSIESSNKELKFYEEYKPAYGDIYPNTQEWPTDKQYRILKKFSNNQYFTDKEKNFIINYLIDCLVENQPFDCSSLGPNKYLNE